MSVTSATATVTAVRAAVRAAVVMNGEYGIVPNPKNYAHTTY